MDLSMGPVLGAVSAGVVCGAGAYAYGGLHSQSQLFGPTLRHTRSAKQFALTFDDGPNPAATPRLLDLLDRHKVRATFFLIGSYVRACPELARETAARGHQICNHTETHPNLFWVSPVRLRQELENCQAAIAEVIGQTPRWMRPPFGARSPFLDGIARKMGFRAVVMWTQMPGDWKPKPAEWLIAKMRPVMAHIEHRGSDAKQGGDILVLHDGDHRFLNADRNRTLQALEYWLPRWRDAGLEFVTIEDVAA
jgi:peptidoglycan/xylan/chitin deacetylase (PgdA/CDA1 family)